jgi:hypothetical protein
VAPLVIEALGDRAALVAVGLLAPAAVAASSPALRRLDARMRIRDADIEILWAVPMLRVLPAATIEQLGAGLEHAEFGPREVVFAQGEAGDRFYVVESGQAEVSGAASSSPRSRVVPGSARSRCWATAPARRPSAPRRTNPCGWASSSARPS